MAKISNKYNPKVDSMNELTWGELITMAKVDRIKVNGSESYKIVEAYADFLFNVAIGEIDDKPILRNFYTINMPDAERRAAEVIASRKLREYSKKPLKNKNKDLSK